jgi:hypothetical protein
MTATEKPDLGWCILELMGHRKMAGYIREADIAGGAFLRVDVPAEDATGPDGPFTATQYYRPEAVYAITPTTMTLAVQVAQGCRVAPVSRWDLPALEPGQILGPSVYVSDDDDDDDDEYDDEPEF